MEDYRNLIIEAVNSCNNIKMLKVIYSFVVNYLS